MFSEPIAFEVIIYSIIGLIVVPAIVASVLFAIKKFNDRG